MTIALSEVQKQKRAELISYFAQEFSPDFAMDLELLLLSKKSLVDALAKEVGVFSDRMMGYGLYFLGTSCLEQICAKYGMPYGIEYTNSKKGGGYGVSISDNFKVCFSNNLRSTKDRSDYHLRLGENNSLLGFTQEEFDFGDYVTKSKTDDEYFYVMVGFKPDHTGLKYDLVFTVPNSSGYKIFEFYIKDLVDAKLVGTATTGDVQDLSLDKIEPKVKLKRKIGIDAL